MELINKEDLLPLLKQRAVARTTEKVETSTFRQPELYGVPIFVIGYAGRVAYYAGQYIAHKVIRKYYNGRSETYWRIITGFIRVFAEHKSGSVMDIFSNGLPGTGYFEFANSPKDFKIYEDRKELDEIEVPEEALVNIEGVLNGEDAFLLIDASGLLRELPHDIFARYSELRHAFLTLQRQLYESSETIKDLRFELDFVHTENRVLRQQLDRLKLRIASVAGLLEHYKSEILRQKELMSFYVSRLEAVKEGKDRIEAVLSEFRNLNETFASLAIEMSEKLSTLEKLKSEVEVLEAEAERLRQKKEALKSEEEEVRGGAKGAEAKDERAG